MLKIKLLLLTLFLSAFMVKADEGMWIPSLLKKYNIKEMKKAGFKLSAKDVYQINQISLKDAILGIGTKSNPTAFTGSASFISKNGLVITNHHTVVTYLQKHSNESHNYVKNGFYARNLMDELSAKNLTLARLIRMEDVTSRLISGTDSLSEIQRRGLIDKRAKELVKKAKDGNHYLVKLKAYFGGSQYFLEVYEVYRDVRIVAMPPLSLAKFGGETDNWRWPRQSADFAILRVYANSQNQSLGYSIANKPIQPIKHLEISRNGYREGDFAMVYGFPGNTKQYLTSRAIKQIVEVKNYHGIKIREAKMEVMSHAINKNGNLWLKYSDLMAKTSNRMLLWKAELRGIEKLNLIQLKKEQEDRFGSWVNSSEELKKKYGNVLSGIESCVSRLDTIEKLNIYVLEAGINGGNLVSFAGKFDMLNAIASRKNVNEKRLNKELRRLRVEVSNFFNSYDLETEKEFLKVLVKLYDKNVGDSMKPQPIIEARKKYHGNFSNYIDQAFESSLFASKEKLMNYLKYFSKEDAGQLDADPIFKLCLSYFLINKEVYQQRIKIRTEYGKLHSKYLQAIREMNPGRKLIADANRSLRVSYGNITGFVDNEEKYSSFSTLNDLITKTKEDAKVYSVPQGFIAKCKESIRDSKTTLNTCFISNSHTTGGNSGSPVLNAKGKLIGINFDRVGNVLVGDYKYMDDLTRQISVDIRYVRFVLEKQLNAAFLLEEWQ